MIANPDLAKICRELRELARVLTLDKRIPSVETYLHDHSSRICLEAAEAIEHLTGPDRDSSGGNPTNIARGEEEKRLPYFSIREAGNICLVTSLHAPSHPYLTFEVHKDGKDFDLSAPMKVHLGEMLVKLGLSAADCGLAIIAYQESRP